MEAINSTYQKKSSFPSWIGEMDTLLGSTILQEAFFFH